MKEAILRNTGTHKAICGMNTVKNINSYESMKMKVNIAISKAYIED